MKYALVILACLIAADALAQSNPSPAQWQGPRTAGQGVCYQNTGQGVTLQGAGNGGLPCSFPNGVTSGTITSILAMGPGGAPVAKDGSADASGAFQNAVTTACATPKSAVYFPYGTYRIDTVVRVPNGCSGLTLQGDPGTVLIEGPSNSSTVAILWLANNSYFSCSGLTFDGNVANVTNSSALVQLSAPNDHVSFNNCNFQNSLGTALNIIGGQPITTTLSAAATAPTNAITVASVPAGLVPGSYIVSNAFIDPDVYVTGIAGTTLTLDRNLHSSLLSGTSVQFTSAFTSSAAGHYGDTTIQTASTANLAVGQVIWPEPVTACAQAYTQITAITANTSVAISKPLLCTIPTSTNFAVMAGNSYLSVINSTFTNIGQPQLYGGSASYTLSSNASGNTMTFPCVSGAGCGRVGLVPGQKTSASGLPTGVPANDLITDLSVNSGAGTFTITLANALTGTITSGTAVPFQVSAAAIGYGIWYAWGAPFANRESLIAQNTFTHTWVAPIYLATTQSTIVQGNTIIEDGMEYVDPNVAASPCMAVGSTIKTTLIGNHCSGASGTGIETTSNVNLNIIGGQSNNNGTMGISVCGGHDVTINGVHVMNNSQYVNRPLVQNYATLGTMLAGVQTSPNCNSGQAGSTWAYNIGPLDASDNQDTPTQQYGVGQYNTTASFTNSRLANITGQGNVSGLIAPGVSLSQATGSKVLFLNTTSSGNGADTTEDALTNCSFSLPGNTLTAAGQNIRIVAAGTFTGSTDSKTARIRWQWNGTTGTAVASAVGSTASALGWYLESNISFIDSAHGAYAGFSLSGNSAVGTPFATTGGSGFPSAQTIAVTGINATNSVANSVQCNYMKIVFETP